MCCDVDCYTVEYNTEKLYVIKFPGSKKFHELTKLKLIEHFAHDTYDISNNEIFQIYGTLINVVCYSPYRVISEVEQQSPQVIVIISLFIYFWYNHKVNNLYHDKDKQYHMASVVSKAIVILTHCGF